ncbi:MAG TPA: 3'-5' exonuclease [Planktothrix sp.]|jgi:inhibitor of KinA sporulation pathway (predicted exonuclease)
MKNNVINVLDRELSCYPDGIFPEGERRETIQYGLCEVNRTTLEIMRTVSIPVKPVLSRISPLCTELTGWTYAKLMKQGVYDKEAIRRLTDRHGSRNRLVVTDSCKELSSMQKQCLATGVEYPFGDETLNISHWFTLVTGVTRNLSLEKKLAYLGLSFEGTPHRADVDAYNIARLLIALIKQGRQGLPADRLIIS